MKHINNAVKLMPKRFTLLIILINVFLIESTFAQVESKNPVFYNFSYKEINYVIPLLAGYNYYNKSVFSKTPLEQFTQSYLINHDEYPENDIVEFNVLIPDDLKKKPTINIHGLKVLLEMEVDLDLFNYSKDTWKSAVKKIDLRDLLDDYLGLPKSAIDSIKLISFTNTGYIIIKDNDNILSLLIIGKSPTNENILVLQNFIYINKTVIFNRIMLPFNSWKDIDIISSESEKFLLAFNKYNLKK